VSKITALVSLATLSCCLSLAVPNDMAVAGPSGCTATAHERPVGSALASAGFFANLRNAKHSLNYLTDSLLDDARRVAHEITHQEQGCNTACPSPVIAIVFRSTPRLLLTAYDEAQECERLYKQTLHKPIVYEKRSFDSEDDAKGWYHDLTTGSGDDGEDLYSRCPGKCSPAYSSVAYRQGEKFIVSASVVCGHARDKDDDQYTLSAAVRWVCP
jgi:hypothetical protein